MQTTKTYRRYFPQMVSPWTLLQECRISVDDVAHYLGCTHADITRMMRDLDGRQTIRDACAVLCADKGTTIIFR